VSPVAIAGIPSAARAGPPAARTRPAAAAGSAVDGARPGAAGVAAAVAKIPCIAGAVAAAGGPAAIVGAWSGAATVAPVTGIPELPLPVPGPLQPRLPPPFRCHCCRRGWRWLRNGQCRRRYRNDQRYRFPGPLRLGPPFPLLIGLELSTFWQEFSGLRVGHSTYCKHRQRLFAIDSEETNDVQKHSLPLAPCSARWLQANQATHRATVTLGQAAHVRWVPAGVYQWVSVAAYLWAQAAVFRWVRAGVCQWAPEAACQWVRAAVFRWAPAGVCQWVPIVGAVSLVFNPTQIRNDGRRVSAEPSEAAWAAGKSRSSPSTVLVAAAIAGPRCGAAGVAVTIAGIPSVTRTGASRR
jgi:hypothetical protein